jgi:hypothetical protein
VEVPTPEPGVGEIRIRVKAIGLNRAEINFLAATYGPPPAFPDSIDCRQAGKSKWIAPEFAFASSLLTNIDDHGTVLWSEGG